MNERDAKHVYRAKDGEWYWCDLCDRMIAPGEPMHCDSVACACDDCEKRLAAESPRDGDRASYTPS